MTSRRIAIVTAGGTREPIDDVRYVANAATGALPCEIAKILLNAGWRVHYIAGPNALRPDRVQVTVDLGAEPAGPTVASLTAQVEATKAVLERGELSVDEISTAAQAEASLALACQTQRPHLAICAMAVADFAPIAVVGKLLSRKDSLGPDGHLVAADELVLRLVPTTKAIDRVKQASPTTFLVGFKLLAGASVKTRRDACVHLAHRSGADVVFANDMHEYRTGLRSGVLLDREGTIVAELAGGRGQSGLIELANQLIESVIYQLDKHQ
ncbi:MAG: hypothetical protein EXR77_00275 [Myxococcales bacterium]|nr:hypothetical protein [Myxococcales bacterium]